MSRPEETAPEEPTAGSAAPPPPDARARVAWSDLFRGGHGKAVTAVAGGVGLHAINVYIATTILPSVVEDIGGLAFYAWTATLFVIASIVGSVMATALLTRLGPRGAYPAAAAVFALGAVICAAAPTMAVLLAGRTVQGLGGGLLFALSYAMVRLALPEALWPRGIALVSMMWGVATLLGPAVGGVFAELGFWRGAFLWLLPPIAYFAWIARRLPLAERRAAGSAAPLPAAKLALLAGAVLAVSAGSVSSDPWRNLAGLAVMAPLLALLVRAERRPGHRLLPRGAFEPATAIAALFATMACLITATNTGIFVPYFAQVLHGLSPLAAGYLAAVTAAGWTLASLVTSGWQGHGARRAAVGGPLVMLAGMALLALLMPWPGVPVAALCPPLALIGIGIGAAWPHLLSRVMAVAAAAERESVGAAITTVQLSAAALATAATGMVVNLAGLTEPGGIAGTSRAAFWLYAAFALAPALGLLTARAALARTGTPARRAR